MLLMDWWRWSWMVAVVVIMIGGELLIVWGYRCLANEVDVSKRPDGDGDQFFSDWGIRQLAWHLVLHQLMHVCWNTECKSWKWVQPWRGEATKAERADDTHFGGAKQFNLYQLLLRCSKRFCPVFDEEVCRTSNHSTCVIFAGQIHDKQLNDESPVVTVVWD